MRQASGPASARSTICGATSPSSCATVSMSSRARSRSSIRRCRLPARRWHSRLRPGWRDRSCPPIAPVLPRAAAGNLLDKLVDRLFLPVDQRDPPLFAEQFEEGIDSHRLRRILLIDEKALAQPPPRAGERPAGQSMVQLGELPLPQRGPWTRLRRGDIGQDLLGPGHQRGQEFFLPDGQLVGLASPFEMVQHDDGLAAEREADPEPGMQQRPTRHVGSQPHLQAQLCFAPLARTVGETPRVLRLQRLPTGQWPIRASTRRA